MPKVEYTKRYERRRVRSPSLFVPGTFRTQDIGRAGYSKRIAGILKRNGWATQSFLISRAEPPGKKRALRKAIAYQKKLARRKRR